MANEKNPSDCHLECRDVVRFEGRNRECRKGHAGSLGLEEAGTLCICGAAVAQGSKGLALPKRGKLRLWDPEGATRDQSSFHDA